MKRLTTAESLGQLIDALTRPTALIEAAALAACLVVAWALVRALRGRQPRYGSVLFGARSFDGVLFPVLALLLALVARWLLRDEVPVAVFRVAVPILLSLAVIRVTVTLLRASFPKSPVMRQVEDQLSWLAWLAVVLWLTGVLPLVLAELETIKWPLGSGAISVLDVLQGTVGGALMMMLALWLSALLEARLLRGATDNISIRKMLANVARALLLFLGLMFALSAAGIDLTALGVMGGALGVGIGLGMQKLAANYVSGFVILAERSMRIGDTVKVDGFEGRITDITTRYTVIRALNGRESIVPNEMLITQRVENSSLADRKVLMSTTVQVAYGTDLDALLPQLAAAVAAAPRVLTEPAPTLMLSAFAADGLELTAAFWIGDPENGQAGVRSDVNLALLRALNCAGVEIPFPQRVVRQA